MLTLTGVIVFHPVHSSADAQDKKKTATSIGSDQKDAFGDPLPEGAIARLGTVRFRHGFNIHAIAFSPGGKVLASAGRFPGLCVFEADTGRLLHRLTDAPIGDGIAFSPDGKTLFTGHGLIDVATGKETRQFNWRDVNVGASAAFSPDGSTVASGGYNVGPQTPIVLWDAETGKELHRLKGHEGEVGAVAFSPTDSKILASGSYDKTVRVWNAVTGKQLHRLEGHDQPVLGVAFAPDGKTIASFAEGGSIRLWDATIGKLLHQMKSDHVRFGSLT
jgi:WD40 repeat protein